MRNKIICITSSLEENTCPIDEYDFDKVIYQLGADYGGERCDAKNTEDYLNSMFGNFATIERFTDDDEDSDITHKLTLNKEAAVEMIATWLDSFKQKVADLTLGAVLRDDWETGRHAISEALDYDVALENVVYINDEFKSIIDFAIRWLEWSKNEDKPFYVCGCVDYHW